MKTGEYLLANLAISLGIGLLVFSTLLVHGEAPSIAASDGAFAAGILNVVIATVQLIRKS